MRVGIGLVAFAGLSMSAFAGPTSLCVIPIADILKHRELWLSYWKSGNERNIDTTMYQGWSTTVGLFDRIELGFDNDLEGNTTYNGKINLFESREVDLGLSVGWQTCDFKRYYEPYVVGRYGVGNLRFHAGLLRTDRWRFIGGLDYTIDDNWWIAADVTSGPNATAWVCLTYSFSKVPGLSVSLMGSLPWEKSDGHQHLVSLDYVIRF